ncbi:MAG: hypothetical protein R2856_32575 [Caldilineaceae bacterium]
MDGRRARRWRRRRRSSGCFDGDGQADANAVRQATERTLDVCLQRLRAERSGQIVGVGWASFAMSHKVDGNGKPVTPVPQFGRRSAQRRLRPSSAR